MLLFNFPVEVEGVHIALEAVGRDVNIGQFWILGQELKELVAFLLIVSYLALVD